ncbi:MAG: GumC family protein, partial [Deltaproteobacteria bacterium]|nr:GumC family protein [Deltaproteobacteria bacterium]
MELLKLWEIVWRRRWIITQAFLVITLTAVIGSYLLTPIYKTSAKVLIKTSDITSSLLSSIGLSDVSSLVTTGSETAIATNIALATIDPVLNEVISKLQLKDKEGDLISPSALQESNIILSTIFPKPHVEVSQDEDADLIEIIASSPNPTEATMIANTLAEVYVEKNLKRRRAEYKSARQFIENRIEIAKSDYLKVLEEIKRFNIREKTVDLEQEKKMAIEKMAELMKEKEDGITDIYETRARIETLKVQLAKQNEMVVSSAAVSNNPQIENLKKQITDIELQLVEELTEKTQDHPDVVALEAKIRKARGELGREIDIFQETSEDLIFLERELAAQEAHLKGVNADIQRYSSLLYTIPEKAFTQSQLELKLSASQEIYSSLLEYLYQIGVAEVMTLTDIRLVETATEPDIEKLASPNKTLNAIMGAFLGLMFGFGLAFLVDYLDDTIKDPAEAKEQELTLLGTIPKSGRKKSPLISMRDPKDPLSESYRTIRNSLKFDS